MNYTATQEKESKVTTFSLHSAFAITWTCRDNKQSRLIVTILLEHLKPEGKGYTSLVSKLGLDEPLVSWGLFAIQRAGGYRQVVTVLLYRCTFLVR